MHMVPQELWQMLVGGAVLALCGFALICCVQLGLYSLISGLGRAEEFWGQRIPGDLWWQTGLVEPAAAGPKCGSFKFPGGKWDLGL